MAGVIVLGAQWGDEGKGKVVHLLAEGSDVVVRFQGGANAGHTIYPRGERVVLHHLPSGVVRSRCFNIVGSGCVIDPPALVEELERLRAAGYAVGPENLLLSAAAHVVLPWHRQRDAAEGGRIGTTRRGIGPCYADKAARCGLRLGDLVSGELAGRYRELLAAHGVNPDSREGLSEELEALAVAGETLRPLVGDAVSRLHEAVRAGRRVLFEGAQGAGLDLDHGSYPFVTSSNTTIGAAYTGAGVYVPFDRRIGVLKAYSTRVGKGPFPTEEPGEVGERLRRAGHEYGSTTGRPRRCGWLDLHQVRRAVIHNGFNALALTKLDVLDSFEEIPVAVGRGADGRPRYRRFPGWRTAIDGARSYTELPCPCRELIAFIEGFLEVPVLLVSVGPREEQTIVRGSLW
jgi:adenylosuccinate synthase